MKILQNILVVLVALLLIGCGGEKKQTGLLTVDVTKTYPEKEIVLQDIANVKYVPLETRDDVLLSNRARVVYVSKDTIVMYNIKEGDIFFFDGQGKFLHSFNHKGQGANEYLRLKNVIYNPPTQEIFVHTRGKPKQKFLVYDAHGKFKREIAIKAKEDFYNLRSFDSERFIAYEEPNYLSDSQVGFEALKKEVTVRNKTPMFLVSKANGSIDTIKKFNLPDRKTDNIIKWDGKMLSVYSFRTKNITRVEQGFVFNNFYCDTIFHFDKKQHLTPILVKTPAKEYMAELPLVLGVSFVTPKYLFVTILEHTARKGDKRRANLCVNRQSREIAEYTLRNKDVQDEEFKVYPHSKLLNSGDLVELLEDGKLSGELKEIAENLQEDDNPVLLKVTYKK